MDLKEKREKKNLTMKELSIRAGVSESMICRIENGDRKPSVKAAKAIARVLGFKWTEFFPDEDQKKGA